MARLLGGDVDYKNAGQKFKSPFFLKTPRQWSHVKDGVLQPDIHYVLYNPKTWTRTFSLDELEDYLKPASLDDMFNDNASPVGDGIIINGCTVRPTVSTVPRKLTEKKSGYTYMWSSGYHEALKCYHPDFHIDVVKLSMQAVFETYGAGVKAYNIKEAVRCVYERAKKSWDQSKKKTIRSCIYFKI
jgi:hypothetical protein